MRDHIRQIRDAAIAGADAKRRAAVRELAELALCFEASSRTNADACRALGKEMKGRKAA
jgi:hypothetical protein